MVKIESALLMVFLMISAGLAGCTVENGADTPEDFGIDSLPIEAIGVNLPIIDGQMFRPFVGIGYDEWIDSYTFPNSDIPHVGFHNGKIKDNEIGLHIKSIGDHVAIALELPFQEKIDVNVVNVTSEFWYDGGSRILNSQRTSSIGEPENPWLEKAIVPCGVLIGGCESELSLQQTAPFEAILIEDEEEEESELLFSGLDLESVATLTTVIQHQLAATQTSSMLTVETMRLDALRFSRSLPSVTFTIEFSDGDEMQIGLAVLDDLYFGYMQPSGWDSADVKIEGVELIQVIQTENMEMPLVKNKPTLARVYVTSGKSVPVDVEVDFKACILIFCTAPITKQVTAPVLVDREEFGDSANFVIPEDWLGFDNVLIVADVRIPYLSEMNDLDTSNNRWVEVFELTETSSLTVGYIRVGQDTDSDSALDQLSVARAQKTMSYSLDLFPINDYTIQSWNWNAGGSMYDATGCSNKQCVENLSAAFDNYLAQLIAAYIMSDCVMENGGIGFPGLGGGASVEDCPLPPIPDQLGALFPPGGTGGGISDPGWSEGSSFVFTCSYGSSSEVHCPAHEMNHNFGPASWDICVAWSVGAEDYWDDCVEIEEEGGGYGPDVGAWGEHLSKTGNNATDDCGTGGQDSVWNGIYGNTGKPFNIKDLGWNYRDSDSENSQSALIPSSFPDIMTYCQARLSDSSGNHYIVPYNAEDNEIKKWMSTYRWLRMHDKFTGHESWNPDGGPFARQAFSPDSHVIRVVHLEFNQKREVVELRSDITSGIMSEKYGTTDNVVRDGEYRIVALGENDQLIDSRLINLEFNDSHGHESRVSSHHVRFEDRGNIVAIKVLDSKNDVIASISSSVDVRAEGAKYNVNMDSASYERGSEMKIEWHTINERGFQYIVEYSKGDGIWYPMSGWLESGKGIFPVSNLPASDNALIRVQMNNGFDSSFMYSTPFKVENQAPTLNVDIRAGHLTINSALPQPHLIPMDGGLYWVDISETMRDRLEKDAEEVLSRAMTMPDIVIPQHGSITITPNVQDLDWEVTNDQGCEVSLEKDGRIVWTSNKSRQIDSNSVNAEILSTYAIDNIFTESKNEPCTSRNKQFSSITFPNPEFSAMMMSPGEYSIKIEYSDSGGAIAEPVVVDFTVEADSAWQISPQQLIEYREKLEFVNRETQLDKTVGEGGLDQLCNLWGSGDDGKSSVNDLERIDMASNCILIRDEKSGIIDTSRIEIRAQGGGYLVASNGELETD